MIVNKNSIYVIILSANFVFSAVTTIDFETAGDGYTPSGTEGSGWEDIFNRTNHNMTSVDNEDGYYWAIEDLGTLTDPYLTLDQISVSGASSFVLQLDMIVHHYNDWDAADEVRITYSVDGGSYQNLMWINSIINGTNSPAALDTDFDGIGECNDATLLPSRSEGTADNCTVADGYDDFTPFTSPVIALSSNSTLDIKIQFYTFTQEDVGLYIDNIIITTNPEKCTISGNSGFRMMSSPVAGQIYSDLLDELWTQGMTGSDVGTSGNANVWVLNGYSGTQSFSELTDITTNGASITAGEGFLLYVFSDTDWDGDDDLPVTISVAGKLNNSSATFPSSGSIAASKYGLAGNPYATTIDFDNITLSGIAVTTSVWDDANSDWKTWNKTSQSGDLSNGLIAPYQGFWIEGDGGSGTITIATADKSSSAGTFYRTLDDDNWGRMVFNALSDGHSSSNYLSFYEGGTVGSDDGESELLLPFQASSRVVMMSVVEAEAHKISSYPYDHEGSVSVPFDVMRLTLDETNYVTVAEEVTLSWNLDQLPDHISMTLTDNITGSETYLDYESEYVFTTEPKGSFSATYDGPIGTYPVVGEPRFTLNVTYGALGQNDDATLPSDFALHPVYPNPFNPSATISFDIPDVSSVALNVYDVKGALVETLLHDHMKPGNHHYNWEPQGLSSGVYFMKLTTAKQTFTQKVTYIK
ncbi:MAG: T9SS type A sorting domain-containing protein [Candidatus Marinimicrobia bacterium]|nr:T9SS type A sorting domain-containing protein [Candidatus Neomarinimicrobiota bacterium]